MRRAIKFLSVLATVCAMAWAASPVWGACGFNIPILQGGLATPPAGALLNAGATHVNGFFWELGFGDPVDGSGNDCLSGFCNHPAFTRAAVLEQWIKGAPAAPHVEYDWRSPGTDGCISQGENEITTTIYAHYIIDSNEDYAIAVLQGNFDGIGMVNLDRLVTGFGVNNNDVPMVPLNGNRPRLANEINVSDVCKEADVLPATCGVNAFADIAGCDPYNVLDVGGLSLTDNGSPVTCDPITGCHLTCITRSQTAVPTELCWVGNTSVIGSQTQGPAVCVGGILDTFPCNPALGDADPCVGFGGGVCPPGPSVTTAMGPAIPGDCFAIDGPNVDDHAIARATKNKGFTVFTWDATQFAVSHYNVYDLTRGRRQINGASIGREECSEGTCANDGSISSYEFVATGRDVRGGKLFELEMVRTDGQVVPFTFE